MKRTFKDLVSGDIIWRNLMSYTISTIVLSTKGMDIEAISNINGISRFRRTEGHFFIPISSIYNEYYIESDHMSYRTSNDWNIKCIIEEKQKILEIKSILDQINYLEKRLANIK